MVARGFLQRMSFPVGHAPLTQCIYPLGSWCYFPTDVCSLHSALMHTEPRGALLCEAVRQLLVRCWRSLPAAAGYPLVLARVPMLRLCSTDTRMGVWVVAVVATSIGVRAVAIVKPAVESITIDSIAESYQFLKSASRIAHRVAGGLRVHIPVLLARSSAAQLHIVPSSSISRGSTCQMEQGTAHSRTHATGCALDPIRGGCVSGLGLTYGSLPTNLGLGIKRVSALVHARCVCRIVDSCLAVSCLDSIKHSEHGHTSYMDVCVQL